MRAKARPSVVSVDAKALSRARRELRTISGKWKRTKNLRRKAEALAQVVAKAKEVLTLEGTLWKEGANADEIIILPDRQGSWLNRFAAESWEKQEQLKISLRVDQLSTRGAGYHRPEHAIWMPLETLIRPADGIPMIAHEIIHVRDWRSLKEGQELMPSGVMFGSQKNQFNLGELFTAPFELRLYALKEAGPRATGSSFSWNRISQLASGIIKRGELVRKASQKWLAMLKELEGRGANRSWKIISKSSKVNGWEGVRLGVRSPSGESILAHFAPLSLSGSASSTQAIHLDLSFQDSKGARQVLRIWITDSADVAVMQRWIAGLEKAKTHGTATYEAAPDNVVSLLRSRLTRLNRLASRNVISARRIETLSRQGDPRLIAAEAEVLVQQAQESLQK